MWWPFIRVSLQVCPHIKTAQSTHKHGSASQVLVVGSDINVVNVVERAPSLLLSDQWSLKDLSEEMDRGEVGSSSHDSSFCTTSEATGDPMGSDSSRRSGRSGMDRLIGAWEFGLSADGDSDWEARISQLLDYKTRVGDPHCGFREGDDAGLVRWAGKQRSDHKRVSPSTWTTNR